VEHERIREAADRGVTYALADDDGRPYRRLAEFLLVLQHTDGWASDDVLAVQSLVIRDLLKRLGLDERDAPDEPPPGPN
jgi:hypothetical protein